MRDDGAGRLCGGATGPILVVEDDEVLCGVLEKALRRDGRDVDTARDGLEALERVRSRRPALVVLDIELPLLDGVGVAQRLRNLCGEMPLILVTTADESPAARAQEAGAFAYLRKPFSLSEFLSVVRAVMTP